MTPAEQATVDRATARVNDVRTQFDRAVAVAGDLTAMDRALGGRALLGNGPRGRRGSSLGAAVTHGELHDWLVANKGKVIGKFQSPAGYVDRLDMHATTLTEGSGSGGALVVPDAQDRIVPSPVAPPVVRDLIAPGTTTSNLVTFPREKTFTNAAAAVKEADPKPESAIVYEQGTAPVRTIAHWIPASTQILKDVPQLASTIDSRLRTGLEVKEDDELLNGTGVDPHLLGFNKLPGLAAPITKGTDTIADAVAKQIAAIQTATTLAPTGIVMNPADWLTVLLMKLTDGSYASGSSPLAAPVPRTLWGLQVAITSTQPVGIVLVGAFRTAAQLFDNESVQVDISNSHEDFFTRNLVAIRAEERIALAVYLESAFGQVLLT